MFPLTYLKKFLRRFRTLKPTPTSPLTRRGFHMTRGLIFIKLKFDTTSGYNIEWNIYTNNKTEKYKEGCCSKYTILNLWLDANMDGCDQA